VTLAALSPRVQVVIPAFNKGARILDAVESVLAQSAGPVLLTVVDDHSTDDTPAYLAQIRARALVHTHVVQTPHNLGAAGARNFGAAHGKTPFVCFLDADDRYHPDFVRAGLSMLARLPMVDALQTGVATTQTLPPLLEGALATTLPGNKIIRRYAFDMIGGFPAHDVFRHGGEDVVFSRLLRRVFNVLQVAEKLYHYDAADSPHFQTYLARASVVDGALQMSSDLAQENAVNSAYPWLEAVVKQRVRARLVAQTGGPASLVVNEDLARLGDPNEFLLRGSPFAAKV
jgi:glycosyltransferase involved in cell wall biosynthesis